MKLADLSHAYLNFFVEPLENLLPWPVTFYRPDNKDGWFAKRTLPLGYWVGHVLGYMTPVALYVIFLLIF